MTSTRAEKIAALRTIIDRDVHWPSEKRALRALLADLEAGEQESFQCPSCHWHEGHDPAEWFAEEVRLRGVEAGEQGPSRREQLEDERNRLLNSFGGGAFHDGMVRDRLAKVDAELAALPQPPAEPKEVMPHTARTSSESRHDNTSAPSPVGGADPRLDAARARLEGYHSRMTPERLAELQSYDGPEVSGEIAKRGAPAPTAGDAVERAALITRVRELEAERDAYAERWRSVTKECDAALSQLQAAERVIEAGRRYRQAETDGTPRMWRGKALQDLATALDEEIAAYDALTTTGPEDERPVGDVTNTGEQP